MRADSHYVDQLDTGHTTPMIRLLPPDKLITTGASETPPAALVESVRRHGVLQPVLVQRRESEHRLIAGRRRRAAAIAVGLAVVPCLIHDVDDDEAASIAAAANLQSDPPTSKVAPETPVALWQGAEEIARSISRLTSCVGLLDSRDIMQRALTDIVRVEACRSWCMATTLSSLSSRAVPRASRCNAKSIAHRVAVLCEPERRLRGVALDVRTDVSDLTDVTVNCDLAIAVISGLVIASFESSRDAGVDRVRFVTAGGSAADLVFSIEGPRIGQEATESRKPFTESILHAAEKTASMYKGRMEIVTREHFTTYSLHLPVA
jgi:hypothetical protein